MYWRLFEQAHRGAPLKTLFHGVNGSRIVPHGVWLQADTRLVRDGTGDNWYHGGFHVVADMDTLLSYLNRFTAPRRLVAVEVNARGLRPKPTNPNILLADEMYVPTLPVVKEVYNGN